MLNPMWAGNNQTVPLEGESSNDVCFNHMSEGPLQELRHCSFKVAELAEQVERELEEMYARIFGLVPSPGECKQEKHAKEPGIVIDIAESLDRIDRALQLIRETCGNIR